MRIQSNEISVVLQGDIDSKYIYQCIQSIRTFLPQAELILSTWEKNKKIIKSLDIDCAVLSKDPGCFKLNKENSLSNNINRQIVSTRRGILKATKKYILKFRTDMKLINVNWLMAYEKFCDKGKDFTQSLMVLEYYTRNPRVVPLPFYVSDWILFGLRKDVLRYYCTVDLQKKINALWYEHHQNNSPIFSHVYAILSPEQHIFVSAFHQNYNIKCREYFDNSRENIRLTEFILAKNFIVIDLKKSGMKFLKYNPNRYWEHATLLTHHDWKLIRYRYAQNAISNRKKWIIYLFTCYKRKFEFWIIRGGVVRVINLFKVRQFIKKFMNNIVM